MSCGVLSFSACDEGQTSVDHIALAEEFRARGDVNGSVLELKNALLEDPESIEARWLLALGYLELGNGAAAESQLGRAGELGLRYESLQVPLAKALGFQGKWHELLELHPASQLEPGELAEFLALRARAYLAQERLDLAAHELDLALEAAPDSPAVKLVQGLHANASQQWGASRSFLVEAVKKAPDSAEAWGRLGDAEVRLEAFDKAEAAYNNAIENAPHGEEFLYKRFLVRIHLNKIGDAEKDAKTLRTMAPNHAVADFCEGILGFRQQDYGTAQTDFENVLRKTGEIPLAEFYLGLSHYAQSHLELALQYLRRFASRFPQIPEAGKALALVQMAERDYAATASTLESVLARDPTDLDTLQLLGEAALRGGKAADSIDYFQRAVAQAPESVDANLRLGQGLMAAGRSGEAIDALERAMKLDPEQRRAMYAGVRAYVQSRQYGKALDAAEQLRGAAPDDPYPWNLIGAMRLAQNDLEGARDAFEKSLALRPGYPPAALNLGNLELSEGMPEKAQVYYNQVLDNTPTDLDALLALAVLEERGGDGAAARDYLEKAIEGNPQALQPRTVLSEYLRRKGEPLKALDLLQPVVPLYAAHPALLLELGSAELAAGRANQAMKTFEKLIGVAPRSAPAYFLLATAAGAAGDKAVADKAFESAVEVEPDSMLAQMALAKRLIRRGELDGAAERVYKLEADFPADPAVKALEAELMLAKGLPAEAAEAYRKALTGSASSTWTVGLARALWLAGDQSAALDTLESWMAAHRGDPLVGYALADAYTAMGDVSKAIAGWRALLKLAPDSWLALNNLAWMLKDSEPASALEHAERALALAPTSPLVQDTAGVLLARAGKAERGMDLLRAAAEADPSNPSIQYHLAEALVAAQHPDDAKEALDQALGNPRAFPEREAASALLDRLSRRENR